MGEEENRCRRILSTSFVPGFMLCCRNASGEGHGPLRERKSDKPTIGAKYDSLRGIKR